MIRARAYRYISFIIPQEVSSPERSIECSTRGPHDTNGMTGGEITRRCAPGMIRLEENQKKVLKRAKREAQFVFGNILCNERLRPRR